MAKGTLAKDLRRYCRIPYSSPVDISWTTNADSEPANGKLIEISVGGLRIEASEYVPVNTVIQFRVDTVDLSGSAVVRHGTPNGAKFILGLELTPKTRQEIGVEIP